MHAGARSASLVFLLLCLPAVALAGQLNLRWNACWGDGGIQNRAFACDTNSGGEQLIASFIPDAAVPGVTRVDATVFLVFPGTSLPPWWQLRGTGACRPTSLVLGFTPPPTAVACQDWAEGGVLVALATYGTTSYLPPQVAVLTASSVLATGLAVDLVPGREYYAFTFTINHAKTVGTGACADCNLGACIGLRGVDFIQTDPEAPVRLYPSGNDDEMVTWQGGAGVGIPNYGGTGRFYCPYVTPARRSTWGDVKSLYR